jgi:hypothetical protein
MANESTQSSFVIYDEEFNSSMVERLNVNIEVWNSKTRGGLVLTTRSLMGHFNKVSMYKALSENVITELDPTVEGSTTWSTFEAFENASVKVKRDVNIKKAVDAFKVMLKDPNATFSQLVGALTADLITKDAIETGLGALLGAIENDASHVLGDYTTALGFKDINKAQFVYGDQFDNVSCILVHSNTARALVDLNIDEKLDSVAGFTIRNGNWASLGIPVVIADLSALVDAGNYKAVFLTQGALMVEASESVSAYTQVDIEARPAQLKFKREWAYNVGVKGYTYDTAVGSYPTKTELATASTWVKTVSDDKDLPCVVFKAIASA